MYKLLIILSLLVLSCSSFSQAIDYSPIYRAVQSEHSFRFSYENDFFSASDRDYTQGVYLELIHPGLSSFPLSKLIWRPTGDHTLHGLSLETNGYTPNQIDRSEIQTSDRPYASTLMLRTFNRVQSNHSKTRITNTLTLGVLGPWAGGREIQSAIHRWIGYTKPLGWHHQVSNEPIVNYQLNYEKVLFTTSRNLLVAMETMARAGTLSTKATAGFAFMIGLFDDPYSGLASQRQFQIYVYDHPMLNVIAHDATLQGGLINRNSPYVIRAAAINRLVFNNRVGLVVKIGSFNLEYWQSFMTKEYRTGIEPKTGGVQVAVKM